MSRYYLLLVCLILASSFYLPLYYFGLSKVRLDVALFRSTVDASVYSVFDSTRDRKSRTFTILYWTTSFYNGIHWFGEGTKPFSTCKYRNCFATSNRTYYNSSDAVIMLMNYIDSYPNYRLPHQKWILHNLEAPTYACKGGCKQYNNLFNATSSYDRRSDIVSNYSHFGSEAGGVFVKENNAGRPHATTNYAKGKTKLVAWFVSSIEAQSKRMAFVQKLKEYIQVDIYGAMAPFTSILKCPRSKKDFCMKMLGRDYKFYLSFENSLCDDYVTEKLWTPIYAGVVPVVLGAFNYSSLLPPQSFIDVRDFKSPKHLASYLTLLDKNDTLYNQYMAWKESYVLRKLPPNQCGFCEYLNLSAKTSKVYNRMDLFWDERTRCQKPEDFYRNMDRSVWEHVGESVIRNMATVL